MFQNLQQVLVTSNRQTCQTLKHKTLAKVRVFFLTRVRLECPRNAKRVIELLNPLRKLEDFLNNPRSLKELVTIHGRKK